MLTRDARVLILDEPTATLSDVEIEHVFRALRLLRDQGRSVLYITHRLGEVFDDLQHRDRAAQWRGQSERERTGEIDRQKLMAMMLGREMGDLYPPSRAHGSAASFAVRRLTVPHAAHGNSISSPRAARSPALPARSARAPPRRCGRSPGSIPARPARRRRWAGATRCARWRAQGRRRCASSRRIAPARACSCA